MLVRTSTALESAHLTLAAIQRGPCHMNHHLVTPSCSYFPTLSQESADHTTRVTFSQSHGLAEWQTVRVRCQENKWRLCVNRNFYKHHRASSQLPINMPMLVSKSHQETNIYNIFAQHVMQQTLQVSLSSITKGLEPKKLDRNMDL